MTEFQQGQQTVQSDDAPPHTEALVSRSRIRTIALWVTIGVLIAGAVLGGVFIIVGGQSAVIGRAFLTLLLVGLFAVAVLIDGRVPEGENRWYLPTSMLLNVFLLIIGLLKVWNGPLQPGDTTDPGVWSAQIGRWLGTVLIVRVALVITQFYVPPFLVRAKSSITRLSAQITVVLIWLTALIYVVPLSFPNLHPLGLDGYSKHWWRVSGATALVAAVCVVIPLVVRAFEPKPPRPVYPAAAYSQGPVYGQSLRYQQAAGADSRPATEQILADLGAADPRSLYEQQYAQYRAAQAEYERQRALYEQAQHQTAPEQAAPQSQAPLPEPPQ